jgi:uncharacterized protein YjbI with pentapeptide repeats
MKLLTALAITAVMFTSSASAFDPADLKELVDNGYCVKCDLTGADLKVANLEGASLKSTYLLGADLEVADLRGANLIGAKLRGTFMNGAIL